MKKKVLLGIVLASLMISVTAYGMMKLYFTRDLTTQVKVAGLDTLVTNPNGDDYKNKVQTFTLTSVSNVKKKVWVSALAYFEVSALKINFSLSASYGGTPISGVTGTVEGKYLMVWWHNVDNVWHIYDFQEPVTLDFNAENSIDINKVDYYYYSLSSPPATPDYNVLELIFTLDTTGVDPSYTDQILDITITITLGE